jgi:Uma2 family endonuclease
MIDIWTLEKRIPIRGLGSTTLKRDANRQGAEADESYYIVNEPAMLESGGIDLTAGPPPDLAIEIDVTGNSLAKLELYAALGVPEVWRFARQSLLVYQLDSDGKYHLAEASLNLTGFPVQQAAEWVARAEGLDETAWAAAFQDWVRSQRPSESDQS